jgi:polysaccharide export outer membrane protein
MNIAQKISQIGATVFVAVGLLAACSSGSAPTSPSATAEVPRIDGGQSESFEQGYILGSGDKIRVIVFEEPDLSGEFDVDGSGRVSMPLLARPIDVSGKTIQQFREAFEAELKNGYLVDPRVSAEVINFRPFYITGEVTRPGEYAYVAGMNVLKAVAMAGGFSYRANKNRVYIQRAGNNVEEEETASQQLIILPGDVIRVPERFF